MLVLNTKLVKIELEDNKFYIVKIRMQDGRYVRCKPYTADIQGLVAAMILSTDIISGKVWLDKVEEEKKNDIYKPEEPLQVVEPLYLE